MQFRTWFAIAVFTPSLVTASAQQFETVKTWTFTLPHGSLEVHLSASPEGLSSLGFSSDGHTPEAPIDEQVESLKRVLAEMPSLGLDPHKLVYAGTRIFGQDVLNRLAYACADSDEWRRTMQNGGKQKQHEYALVIGLLNSSGAYASYNEALKAYGIQTRVTEVEKVFLMPFSRVQARQPQDRREAKLLVPADAQIGMRFYVYGSNPDLDGYIGIPKEHDSK
jgi:hypothetical protein